MNQNDPQNPLTLLGRILEWFRLLFLGLTERYNRVWQTIKAVWKPIGIVLRPFVKLFGWLWHLYRTRIFNRYAYHRDADGNSTNDLSPKRAATVILITVAFFYTLSWLKTLAQDIYYIQTAQEVTLYFGKPEFHSDLHIYQVTGCESQKECVGGDNALIFDIPDNLALDISYTFTRAKGYDPEHEIVSAFNSEYQKCTVTSKGRKPIIVNYFIGKYRWHPKILDKAVCTPVVNM